MAMLEGEKSLTLEALNYATQAWVEQEYHRSCHTEIKATPLAHYLAGPNVGRECPTVVELSAAFCIEVKRRQRRSDGTISLAGKRYEIPSQYRNLQDIHIQYARWDMARVDIVDPRTGTVLSAIWPMDKSANANGQRRSLTSSKIDLTPQEPKELPALMKEILADYAATGIPPSYLPSYQEDTI